MKFINGDSQTIIQQMKWIHEKFKILFTHVFKKHYLIIYFTQIIREDRCFFDKV